LLRSPIDFLAASTTSLAVLVCVGARALILENFAADPEKNADCFPLGSPAHLGSAVAIAFAGAAALPIGALKFIRIVIPAILAIGFFDKILSFATLSEG